MSFLKKFFEKKHAPIKSYHDFWTWFKINEKLFHKAVSEETNIEEIFFDRLTPKLNQIKDGFSLLTGMYDNETAELIVGVDGDIGTIVFAEELIQHAPNIPGWRFTALKPPTNIENVRINMNGYVFSGANLFFYSDDLPGYPDEVRICVVHDDLTNDNYQQIANGIYVFLDNYLGELDLISNIDNIRIIPKENVENKLIPMAKLKDFIAWRQKEFIEKYDAVVYDGVVDNIGAVMEAETVKGNKLIASINTQYLKWNKKASHPWVGMFTLKYNGNNGLPDKEDVADLYAIEDDLLQQLKEKDGYLNIGRQTSEGERDILFCCKDFRELSKIFHNKKNQYQNRFEIDYSIYKDKYWKSFERFDSAS